MDEFKKIIFPILGVIVFISCVGILIKKSDSLKTHSSEINYKEVKIKNILIKAEVAQSEDERKKGLSGRDNLAPDSGMLFVLGTKTQPTFWMKGMKIPLDIIWIDDNKIVKIDKNIPSPQIDTPDDKLELYQSKQPVDYVLEVNAGFCDQNKIQIGDMYENY